MKIYKNIFKNYKIKKKGVISIGYFDTVHLGHKKIVNELLRISEEKKSQSYLLTFKTIFYKEQYLKKVLPFEDKIEILKKLNIDNLIICDFNEVFSLPPNEFINILKENFNINDYVISKVFKFGYNKSGNEQTLRDSGCNVNYVKPFTVNSKIVSTTRIKILIKDGKIEKANSYLGYNYFINGKVIKGKQIGRKIGFPTMNLKKDSILLPANGVYITNTIIKRKRYNSMTYISDGLIETYLIGYKKFHYKFKIKIDFFKKIRDNAVFNDISKLKIQLEKDLIKVKDFFDNKGDINDNN